MTTLQLEPLPFNRTVIAELQRREPELWRWFSSAEASAQHDPGSGRWTPTGGMTDYWGPEAVLLQDGRVLRAGGGETGGVYSPATGTWTATGPRVHSLVGGAALALLPNGQVLSVGGSRLANGNPKGCGSEPVTSAELYTP